MQTESTVTIPLYRFKELENYENLFNQKGMIIESITYSLTWPSYNRKIFYVGYNENTEFLNSVVNDLNNNVKMFQKDADKWKQIQTFTKSKFYKVLVKLNIAPFIK